ncbi:uncharacterized protein LOC143283108 [Babylonia areolata]|uniref:uncharacterized protein LOC143283108 n=1 Tax=Babylonia areolata TaxID=304850 RepID=UPI003FD53566
MQGQSDPSNNLLKDDFLLCIQTACQRDMMKHFSRDMIFIDSTHSTTQYQFLLTTILVADDFGEGIPVAWAISNKEDSSILEVFLHAVKTANNGEDYQTNTFMSDLASSFYNAWCAVFPVPKRRLYCTWHVDKAWRKKLRESVPDMEEQAQLYYMLCMLRSEVEEGIFCKKMTEFEEYCNQNFPNFHNYFQSEYVRENRVLYWAACFRKGVFANTNMYVESFHRVLKDIYFQRKQNKRVDSLLFVLLQLARDKACEQLYKCHMGKMTHRLREILIRHKSALTIKDVEEHGNEWIVLSAERNDVQYYVIPNETCPECKCKQTCTDCGVCPHMFSCTCADFLTRTIPCKHIHAVQMARAKSRTCDNSKEEPDQADDDILPDNNEKNADDENFTENYTDFAQNVCKKDSPSSFDLKQLHTQALQALNNLIDFTKHTKNIDAVKSIITNVSSALSIAKGFEALRTCDKPDVKFEVKEPVTGNKHFEAQRKFYATKRKPGRSRLRLSKPDSKQTEEIKLKLSQITPNVCAVCLCKEDKALLKKYFGDSVTHVKVGYMSSVTKQQAVMNINALFVHLGN